MTTNSSNKPAVPSNLIAFPSVSSSLHSLPQATSIHNVALHPNMYAQRAAESEEKLRNALSKTPSSFTPQQPMMYSRVPPPSPPQDSSAPLMMRSKSKFST